MYISVHKWPNCGCLLARMETLEEYVCPFIISLKFDLLMTGGEMQVSMHDFGNLKKIKCAIT